MERKFKITVDGRQYNVAVEELTELNNIPNSEAGYAFPRQVVAAPSFAPASPAPAQATPILAPAEVGDVVSTLGGVIESLLVEMGQKVTQGERVVVVEAMKMKTPITAPKTGEVSAIMVNVGDGVQTGQVLIKLA